MEVITTILITVLIGGLIVALLVWVKNPFYRCTREEFVQRIEQILMGQTTDNQWRLLTAMSFHYDPLLVVYQNRLVEIEEAHWRGDSKPPYLFTKAGLSELQTLRDELITEIKQEVL